MRDYRLGENEGIENSRKVNNWRNNTREGVG
jgi:hypothetical protein